MKNETNYPWNVVFMARTFFKLCINWKRLINKTLDRGGDAKPSKPESQDGEIVQCGKIIWG